jgi:hypothetical protein
MRTFCTRRSAQRNSDSINSLEKWQDDILPKWGESQKLSKADLWVEIILPAGFSITGTDEKGKCQHTCKVWADRNGMQTSAYRSIPPSTANSVI